MGAHDARHRGDATLPATCLATQNWIPAAAAIEPATATKTRTAS